MAARKVTPQRHKDAVEQIFSLDRVDTIQGAGRGIKIPLDPLY